MKIVAQQENKCQINIDLMLFFALLRDKFNYLYFLQLFASFLYNGESLRSLSTISGIILSSFTISFSVVNFPNVNLTDPWDSSVETPKEATRATALMNRR